jgi:hypothetical protein
VTARQEYSRAYYLVHRAEKIAAATAWNKEHLPRRREIVAKSEKQHWEQVKEKKYQRSRNRSANLVAEHGGQCIECGTTERLHFHHVDPSTKVDSVSQMLHLSPDKARAEAEKCVLLCISCHSRVPKGVPSGT